MPITVKHSKISTIPDDADTSLVRPSDWNADHTLVGLGTMAEQNANNVNITGGSITGVTGVGTVTSIIAGSGLSGGTITNSGTIALDINGLSSTTVAPNDLVPVYDVSATANADCLASDIAGLGVGAIGYKNDYYYFPHLMASAGTSGSLSANQIYYVPFFVRKKTTFTRIGIQVAVLGGTIARLGIYNAANGVPTSLVLDCGTVSTASIGEKEATISQSLNVGFYYLAVVSDGAPTIQTTTNNAAASSYSIGQSNRTTQIYSFNALNGSTTLPNPAQTSLSGAVTAVAISLRVV